MNIALVNEKLRMMCMKYALESGGEISANSIFTLKNGEQVNLLPWRVERRFSELKKIIESNTLENVSTLRFVNMSGKMSLSDMLFKELDLCEFLGHSRVVRTFAVMNGDDIANVLVKLADGKSCSVECSTALPAGTAPLDRHEIIARRGVACDRTVDTQVPQSSIYLFGKNGSEIRYTDTDAELFGLNEEETLLIRSAVHILKQPETAAEWNCDAQRISAIVGKTLQCAADNMPAHFEEL